MFPTLIRLFSIAMVRPVILTQSDVICYELNLGAPRPINKYISLRSVNFITKFRRTNGDVGIGLPAGCKEGTGRKDAS